MSVQRESLPDHTGVPWDPDMDNWQPALGSSEFHLDHFTTKRAEARFTRHADSDPTLFPAFDPSSYFEFHGSADSATGLPKMTEDWATLMDSMLDDLPTTFDAVQEHGHAS